MNGFLSKPIIRKDLENVLATAAGGQAIPIGKPQIDVAAALDRVGGDRELLHDVALLFLGEYPKSMAEIRSAVEDLDAPRLERAAHTLKGSVANFGAAATVDAALEIEKMGRSGDLHPAIQALLRLETAMDQLVPELERL